MHREDKLHTEPNVIGVQSVAIIGLGLMGGSLGLALKRYCPHISVIGYARRAETRTLAMEMGACDAVTDSVALAVCEADVVVLCTPILEIANLVETVRDALRPGAIVTDVGSTKAMLTQQVGALLADRDACFIGSHPMAGSERTGMEAAQEKLYVDAVVIVTPPADGAYLKQSEIVQELWRAIGARVLVIDAGQHDAIVASTSHVPHLLAALLVLAAGRAADKPGAYCGPGFRDATRIAAGSEWVWHDIVKSNTASIAASLQDVRADIDMMLDALDRQDFDAIRNLLGEARALREQVLGVRS